MYQVESIKLFYIACCTLLDLVEIGLLRSIKDVYVTYHISLCRISEHFNIQLIRHTIKDVMTCKYDKNQELYSIIENVEQKNNINPENQCTLINLHADIHPLCTLISHYFQN